MLSCITVYPQFFIFSLFYFHLYVFNDDILEVELQIRSKNMKSENL